MLESECRAAGVQIFTGVQMHEVERSSHFLVCAAGGGVRVGGASRCNWRSVDSEDRRDSLWLRAGEAVWRSRFVRAAPALVPLVFDAEDRQQLLRSGWCFHGSNRVDRQAAVSREDADHASRPEWAGNPANFFLLGQSPADCDRSRSGAGDYGHAEGPARDGICRPRKARLHEALPIRLAERWLELHPPQRWTNAELDKTSSSNCIAGRCMPSGTEGYEKAEVTAGGVDTDELSAKTMEARKVPGSVLHRRGSRRDRTTWAASTFSGHGPRDIARGRPCDESDDRWKGWFTTEAQRARRILDRT